MSPHPSDQLSERTNYVLVEQLKADGFKHIVDCFYTVVVQSRGIVFQGKFLNCSSVARR